MSEQMVLEGLVAEWLGMRLRTALHQSRFRLYRPENLSYSDLDAIAVSVAEGRLAIGEVKVQGPALAVYAVSSSSPNPILTGQLSGYAPSLQEKVVELFANNNKWASNELQLSSGVRPWAKLRHLELWLVANVYIAADEREAVDARFTRELRAASNVKRCLPGGTKSFSAHIRSTFDVVMDSFCKVEQVVTKERWGARFGHDQLDLLRELVRYKNASVCNGGRGKSAECAAAFRRAVESTFTAT